MSAEDNVQVVETILKAIGACDMATVLANVHDDGTWSVPYCEDRFPFAGVKNKQAFGEMVGGFLSAFSEFSMDIKSITAQGDRVSAIATSAGIGPGGATYKNIYHFSFVMKDGKAHTTLEFFDPFEVLAYVEQLPQ